MCTRTVAQEKLTDLLHILTVNRVRLIVRNQIVTENRIQVKAQSESIIDFPDIQHGRQTIGFNISFLKKGNSNRSCFLFDFLIEFFSINNEALMGALADDIQAII